MAAIWSAKLWTAYEEVAKNTSVVKSPDARKMRKTCREISWAVWPRCRDATTTQATPPKHRTETKMAGLGMVQAADPGRDHRKEEQGMQVEPSEEEYVAEEH